LLVSVGLLGGALLGPEGMAVWACVFCSILGLVPYPSPLVHAVGWCVVGLGGLFGSEGGRCLRTA
jgi:hypothetical protein